MCIFKCTDLMHTCSSVRCQKVACMSCGCPVCVAGIVRLRVTEIPIGWGNLNCGPVAS